MQRIYPKVPALSAANALEELCEQAGGGSFWVHSLVVRMEKPDRIDMYTVVNHGSPGSVQDWHVLGREERVFETEGGKFNSPEAEQLLTELLWHGEWYGAAVPYDRNEQA